MTRAGAPGSVLGRRALNRATLARQMLLHRAKLPVSEAVAALVGLQAQTTHSWYVGLGTRLEGLEPKEVGKQLEERRLVRVALMRSTIHLVTAEDCLALRPVGSARDRAQRQGPVRPAPGGAGPGGGGGRGQGAGRGATAHFQRAGEAAREAVPRA